MKFLLFLVIFSLTILLDQATKQMAVEHRSLLDQTAYLNGLLRFRYAENTGLFLNFGDHFSEQMKFWLFTVLVLAGLILLIFYTLSKPRLPGWILVGLATVMGGGMSNVLDRFQHQGAVIDFVYLELFDYRSAIFNVADLMISCGGLILILCGLKRLLVQPVR